MIGTSKPNYGGLFAIPGSWLNQFYKESHTTEACPTSGSLAAGAGLGTTTAATPPWRGSGGLGIVAGGLADWGHCRQPAGQPGPDRLAPDARAADGGGRGCRGHPLAARAVAAPAAPAADRAVAVDAVLAAWPAADAPNWWTATAAASGANSSRRPSAPVSPNRFRPHK